MRLLALTLAAALAFAQAPPFVPASFAVPQGHKTARYQLVPLGPELARQDYDAYMGSIEHLQQTFTHSTRWPHAQLTMDDARKDVEGEGARFKARRSFTYAVLTPDGARELGCVYIQPSAKQGYDAMVRLWVTKAEFDRGFDAQLERDTKLWIAKAWPFRKVAWPGRDMPMDEWRKLPDQPRP